MQPILDYSGEIKTQEEVIENLDNHLSEPSPPLKIQNQNQNQNPIPMAMNLNRTLKELAKLVDTNLVQPF